MTRRIPTNPDTPDWTLTPQQETAVDLLSSGKTITDSCSGAKTSNALRKNIRPSRLTIGASTIDALRTIDENGLTFGCEERKNIDTVLRLDENALVQRDFPH